jgi:HlyD family secretion protein
MGMDRKIEKKKGIRPKHIVYTLSVAAFIVLLFYLLKLPELSTLSCR